MPEIRLPPSQRALLDAAIRDGHATMTRRGQRHPEAYRRWCIEAGRPLILVHRRSKRSSVRFEGDPEDRGRPWPRFCLDAGARERIWAICAREGTRATEMVSGGDPIERLTVVALPTRALPAVLAELKRSVRPLPGACPVPAIDLQLMVSINWTTSALPAPAIDPMLIPDHCSRPVHQVVAQRVRRAREAGRADPARLRAEAVAIAEALAYGWHEWHAETAVAVATRTVEGMFGGTAR